MFSACKSSQMDSQSAEKWTSPRRTVTGYVMFIP